MDRPLNSYFGSGGGEALARRGWHFHVSRALAVSSPQRIPHLIPSYFLFQLGVRQ
jgi:hypothetical protein